MRLAPFVVVGCIALTVACSSSVSKTHEDEAPAVHGSMTLQLSGEQTSTLNFADDGSNSLTSGKREGVTCSYFGDLRDKSLTIDASTQFDTPTESNLSLELHGFGGASGPIAYDAGVKCDDSDPACGGNVSVQLGGKIHYESTSSTSTKCTGSVQIAGTTLTGSVRCSQIPRSLTEAEDKPGHIDAAADFTCYYLRLD